MFGKNPIAKKDINDDGMKLRVVGGHPFFTIQGEGPYAGMPAVFLRLHGCPLQCFFCDTEFSGATDPYVPVEEIANEVFALAGKNCRLLVITGGEPVRQNLAPLITYFTDHLPHWILQIETSGILWQDCLVRTEIVVSPKTPAIHPKIQKHAAAFKYVIQEGQLDGDDGLPFTNTQVENGEPRRLARPKVDQKQPVYLSPMDEYDPVKNTANQRAVARIAMQHGYRAGLQLHKFLGVD